MKGLVCYAEECGTWSQKNRGVTWTIYILLRWLYNGRIYKD